MSNLSAEKSNKTKQVDLLVSGMTCSSCVGTVEKSLNKLPGIRAVVNLAMETAHVIAPVEYSEDQLINAVNTSGYSAQVLAPLS